MQLKCSSWHAHAAEHTPRMDEFHPLSCCSGFLAAVWLRGQGAGASADHGQLLNMRHQQIEYRVSLHFEL